MATRRARLLPLGEELRFLRRQHLRAHVGQGQRFGHALGRGFPVARQQGDVGDAQRPQFRQHARRFRTQPIARPSAPSTRSAPGHEQDRVPRGVETFESGLCLRRQRQPLFLQQSLIADNKRL